MWQGDVSFFDSLIISLTGMLVVMLELIVIAVFIVILSKIIRSFNKKKSDGIDKTAKPDISAQPEKEKKNEKEQLNTKNDGRLDFKSVSPEEAAVIMAAVSAESGIPLDRTAFKSIKKI